MDFSSSFKNSFKSQRHGRRISAGSVTEDDEKYENQPILSDHRREASKSAAPHHQVPGFSEVIVKIDGGSDRPAATTNPCNKNIWRESSLQFWGEGGKRAMQKGGFTLRDDPPLKLIGQFLNEQKAVGGETSLDMDLEMDELRLNNNRSNNATVPLNSSSFKDQNNSDVVDIGPDEQKNSIKINGSSSEEDQNLTHRRINQRRSINVENNFETSGGSDEGQVLRCTSVQMRVSNLGRLKTRSRLMDPPEIPDRVSGILKSGQIESRILGRASGMIKISGDDEEDDPLFDEDLPDEYKKDKLDALTIAQWISLILLVTALACTLVISKLVSGWGIRVVVFFVERNFFMRKRVLYFVYGIRKAVQNCIWLGLVLISWHYMLDQKVEGNNEFLQYVNKLMICMLVGTSLWLVKTLMVKVLASSFHVSTFFDRIQETLFNQYVIETLSGPPFIEMQSLQEEEERTMAEVLRLQNAGASLPPELRTPSFLPLKSQRFTNNLQGGLPPKPVKGVSFKIPGQIPKNQEDKGLSIDTLHKLNNKNVSAWNMKRLMNTVKHGVVMTLDERVPDSSQADEAATQIKSEYEAKVAARKIFRNVAKPGAKFIYPIDLMCFLRDEEALKTLNVIEGSTESEKISKASLKSWVVNAFREQKALALTLNDTKTAVNKLHQMVNVIVGVIIFVICLVILEIATSKFLLFISSQIVVVAFIFGNTCKTVFEAVIFVFVMHPFDVGDRCEVDGVQMIVEEMNILTTVFLRFDNQKILYPNVTLATKPISNYYRSPDMGDSVDFAVHIATPVEKIAVIKQRITSYIENKSEHWYPSPTVVLMNLEDLHKLKLSVWMRHRMNHQDMGERWNRRALFVEEMVKIFKELDIQYRLYPIDINIRAMPPLNSSRNPSTWPPPPVN
ncbi:mechanosensitive ion channel protein 5-like [Dorcoceras hygrometricum]|uniref:Mechanosensitive ion channel protein n=1 Tax=Dorcoceras hygrometricum TaxID=472368 RepID=A0A2Z7DKD1_9LAMI|nr:mechanosensitive ion channel protein 5-like [Dorcoceras hygrometricum]